MDIFFALLGTAACGVLCIIILMFLLDEVRPEGWNYNIRYPLYYYIIFFIFPMSIFATGFLACLIYLIGLVLKAG
jgi:hypothetical protein